MSFVLVHGGAGDHGRLGLKRRIFCRKLVSKGKHMLDAGQHHETVAVELCSAIEASGLFNAGSGSHLTENGLVEQDAGFCTSKGMISAAVGAVPGVTSACRVAHALYRQRVSSPDPIGRSSSVLLSGQGARSFAQTQGLTLLTDCSPSNPHTRKAHAYWSSQLNNATVSDTVGVVVSNGVDLSLATSSGGAIMKPAGRIGPAAVNGAGFAIVRTKDKITAVLTTGNGEDILTTSSALQAALRLSNSSPDLSYEPDVLKSLISELSLYELQATPLQMGLVCIQISTQNKKSSICHAYTCQSMLVALHHNGRSRACLSKNPVLGRLCIESL